MQIEELSKTHAEENSKHEREWEVRKKKVELEYGELIDKKL